MSLCRLLAVGLCVTVGLAAPARGAEHTTPQDAQEAASSSAPKPVSPYEGSWLTWPRMTGDWGGARTALAEKGITLDVNVTQIMQDNVHGGASTKDGLRYSGSGDITLTLDTGKMGLWPGGTLLLNAEPKWGDGVGGKVGSLIPVNMDAIKPGYGEGCMFTLSEFYYQQVLFDGKLVVLGGKLDGSRAFDSNVFANDERTQFMNVAFRNNPTIGGPLPYTTLGVAVIFNPVEWLSIRTAVVDAEGRAKTTGFNTAFHGPTHTSLDHEWTVKVKPFGLDGNQRVAFVWCSKEIQALQPKSPFREMTPLLLKVLGPKMVGRLAPLLPFEQHPDGVGIYYNFDQYLYQEAEDRTQGFGVFGRFGWARQDICPLAHFYSIGMGGKGVLPERDHDTMGIGYYFVDLSNDLPESMHSEQGIECYYNIEITPWLHISPDLQVIVNPGGTDDRDTSVVWGLRAQVNL